MTTFRYRQDTKPGTFNAMFAELGQLLLRFQRKGIGADSGIYRMPQSAITLKELVDDPLPADGETVWYARDNGGKTELVSRFSDGTVERLAIEP